MMNIGPSVALSIHRAIAALEVKRHMPMTEQTMTLRELVTAYDAGRTAHMETRYLRGGYDPRYGDDIMRSNGKPVTEDILVITAEVQHEGQWRKVEMVGTDANDESEPAFLDLEPRIRVTDADGGALTMDDTVMVRGLSDSM